MPDLWMDVDTALTSVPVNILPLIDDTDFKSREVAIAYDEAGMDLVWNFTTTGGVTTQTAVTPTTGGNYDWSHNGDGMYVIEIPASGGASINNDTEGFGWFSGYCNGVLPWRGPTIGFRAAALNDALIDGGDELDVNVTKVSDTSQTANDNGADINTLITELAKVPKSDGTASWNATALAAINAECDTALTDYDAVVAADFPLAANVTQIDGQATSGNNATLNLKQLNIVNSAGSAIIATSSGSNGHGMVLAGNGTGEGLSATGGATGHGIHAVGGASSGRGIYGQASAGNDHGIYGLGNGSGNGLLGVGGATGNGIVGTGGGTSGAGIYASATSGNGMTLAGGTNGHGISTTGAGSGHGLFSDGGATGSGINARGGATSGYGILANGQNSDGFRGQSGGGNGHGMSLAGNGTGNGLYGAGGATGNGILGLSGSGATGDGIKGQCQATNGSGLRGVGNGTGNGLHLSAGATGSGIKSIGGATSGHGIYAYSQNGNSDGLRAVGDGSGNGILADGGSGAGDGMHCIGGATGGPGMKCEGRTNDDGITLVPNGTGTGLDATTISASSGMTANITGNLSGSVGSVTGAVGSVTGAVGSVTGAVGSVTGNVGGNVTGSVGSVVGHTAQTGDNFARLGAPAGASIAADIAALPDAAAINAEVVDALDTDTYAEPGQEAPGATVSLATKISYLYKFLRNKITNDGSTIKVYADDKSTVDHKSTVSESGGTVTRDEFITGA